MWFLFGSMTALAFHLILKWQNNSMQAQFHDPQFNFHFKCYFNCRRQPFDNTVQQTSIIQPFDGSIQHCTLRLVLSTDSQPKSVMDHKEPKIMFLLFYHRLSTTSLARVRSERKHLSRSSSVQSVSVDSFGSLVQLVPWFRWFCWFRWPFGLVGSFGSDVSVQSVGSVVQLVLTS